MAASSFSAGTGSAGLGLAISLGAGATGNFSSPREILSGCRAAIVRLTRIKRMKFMKVRRFWLWFGSQNLVAFGQAFKNFNFIARGYANLHRLLVVLSILRHLVNVMGILRGILEHSRSGD